MSKMLITGFCGMIGSNQMKRLVKEGNNVFVIDNLWRGKLEHLNDEEENIVTDLKNVALISRNNERTEYIY